jgi:MATE family multidrug resistance protein
MAELYTADPTLIAIAGSLIPIAGFFQVFDGLQAVGAGVLRGLGDTRVPLVAMLSGYWLIGVPVSVVLAFRTGMGPQGLWWGFVAGLAAVAVFLLMRVRALFRRSVHRVLVD